MTTLFEKNPTDHVDENKDYLAELVGEEKKFKSPQDLARSKVEADRFIDQLKGELQGLREELNAKMKLEDLLTKMETVSQKPPSSEVPPNREEGKTALTPEELEAILDSKLNEREQSRIQAANIQEAKRVLSSSLGNDYAVKLDDKARSLGISREFLDNLAKTQPKALFKLLDVDPTANTNHQSRESIFSPPSSGVRSEGFKPQSNDKTQSYYESLRKADAKSYWSPSVQNQMHKDAMRLGERFFD